MRLKLHDMETENDWVAKKGYFDLFDILAEVGEEEDGVFICQKRYVEHILKKFGMASCWLLLKKCYLIAYN